MDHFDPAIGGSLSPAIDTLCRTAALGGHKKRCNRCGHEEISYNSCRNRHCPKCQAQARAEWLQARERELLEVPYFHVVFTLPDEIGPLALQNKRQVCGILFRAAAESLVCLASDPRHLGASIGFLLVLYTWGQNLHLHPHVRAVVPGGGLSFDGHSWVASPQNFFLPVRALSRLFRGKFLDYLQQSFDQGSSASTDADRDDTTHPCPQCRQGWMLRVETISPSQVTSPTWCTDTS